MHDCRMTGKRMRLLRFSWYWNGTRRFLQIDPKTGRAHYDHATEPDHGTKKIKFTEADYELAESLWPGLSRVRLRDKMEENEALLERVKGET